MQPSDTCVHLHVGTVMHIRQSPSVALQLSPIIQPRCFGSMCGALRYLCSRWMQRVEETKRNIAITISIHQYADILRYLMRATYICIVQPAPYTGTCKLCTYSLPSRFRWGLASTDRATHGRDSGPQAARIPIDYPAEKETLLRTYVLVNKYFEFGRFIVSHATAYSVG